MVDSCGFSETVYRIFSLLFTFRGLKTIINNLPNHVFESITHLKLRDDDPFDYEFFVQLTRAFLCLQHLSIFNSENQFWELKEGLLYLKIGVQLLIFHISFYLTSNVRIVIMFIIFSIKETYVYLILLNWEFSIRIWKW